RPSLAYRRAHAEGARWSIRPRLVADLQAAAVPQDQALLLIADDDTVVRLAALDLQEAGWSHITWTRAADTAAWPQQATPQWPSDADAIDHLFFVHDRHDGNLDAARRYLAWETGLIAQCAPDELAVFRLPVGGNPA
ncbi:MAG: sulfurtransferase, partial [Rubrivivax sp.]